MPSNLLSKLPNAHEIADRIRKVGDDIVTVARDLVAAIDVNPKILEELVEREGIPRDVLRHFERLGRGQIHPSLALTTSPGGRKLLSAPLSEQTLALSNGVEILDDDEVTTRNIPVNELTPSQATQAIAGGKIRTIAEQRTYLRQKKASMTPAQRDADYKVFKDRVVTSRKGTWSKRLILQWVMEMG